MRAKSFSCILCQGLVAYSKGGRSRFDDHMNVEHGVSANLNFILAGCLMTQEEREVVAAIIEEREEGTEETFTESKEIVTESQEEIVTEYKEEIVTERKEETVTESQEETIMEETLIDCEFKFDEMEPFKINYCEFCSEKCLSKQSLFLHNMKNHKEKLQRKRNNSTTEIVLANVEPAKKKSKNEQLSIDNIITEKEQDIMKTKKDPISLTLEEILEYEILIECEQRNPSKDIIVFKEDAKKIKEMEQQQPIFEEIIVKSREDKTQEPSTNGRKTNCLGGPLQSIKSKNPNLILGGIMKPVKSHNPNRRSEVTEPNEKQKIVIACNFFNIHPNDLMMYDGKGELKEVETLPPGWKIRERILTSGRKIVSFISPDQMLSFRSKVGVFEYLKFEARYTEEELQNFSKNMKVKVSSSQ